MITGQERNCKECGKVFKVMTDGAGYKFCSSTCKKLNYLKYQAKERAISKEEKTKRKEERNATADARRKKYFSDYMKAYHKDPEAKRRHKIRCKTDSLIAAGVIKKLPCILCGSDEYAEFHHTSYDLDLKIAPFVGVFLCQKCHREMHGRGN